MNVKDLKILEYLRCWKNEIDNKIKTYSEEKYECSKKLENLELEPYKTESYTQPADKTKVTPSLEKIDYGEIMLKDVGINKDMLEKIKSGEIAPIKQVAEFSPIPNAKQQTAINKTKFNIDKQTTLVGQTIKNTIIILLF